MKFDSCGEHLRAGSLSQGDQLNAQHACYLHASPPSAGMPLQGGAQFKEHHRRQYLDLWLPYFRAV